MARPESFVDIPAINNAGTQAAFWIFRSLRATDNLVWNSGTFSLTVEGDRKRKTKKLLAASLRLRVSFAVNLRKPNLNQLTIFPSMLIEEEALRHWIDNFYGYGSWRARFWFIGYEEGGGEVPEEVAEKVNYFYETHDATTGGTLCDIRDVYKRVSIRWDGHKAGLFDNRREYRFGSHATQNGIWKNLIAFLYGYKKEELPDLLAYQKQTFASPSVQSEALIKLYPLPAPHSHAWYYSWLDLPQLTFLKSRPLYEEHVYQRRMETILSNISAYRPEVVLMYGMDNINKLKTSVQDFFDGAKFKMIKAIKRHIPQHHRVEVNGTTILITTQIPALKHNRFETGFDWEEFGKTVKSQQLHA